MYELPEWLKSERAWESEAHTMSALTYASIKDVLESRKILRVSCHFVWGNEVILLAGKETLRADDGCLER